MYVNKIRNYYVFCWIAQEIQNFGDKKIPTTIGEASAFISAMQEYTSSFDQWESNQQAYK